GPDRGRFHPAPSSARRDGRAALRLHRRGNPVPDRTDARQGALDHQHRGRRLGQPAFARAAGLLHGRLLAGSRPQGLGARGIFELGRPVVVEPAQYAYENWVKSTGLPVHRGYYVEDVREIELGRWDARDCNAAFLILKGQQNVSEARVTEILPGKSLPPLKFAFDEIVYVAEGQGICTVWQEGGAKRSFEWHKHAMFLLPRNHYHQLANARGDRRVILLHNNYLPVAMAGAPDPELYFNTDCAAG